MAGRRKTKGAKKSDSKALETKRREGIKTKGPVGVEKRAPKHVPKANVKRAQLLEDAELSKKEGRQLIKNVPKPGDPAAEARDETSPNTSSNKKTNSSECTESAPLSHPSLLRTLNLLDEGEEEFCVHDMTFVTPDKMVVVSVPGLAKAISIKDNTRTLSTLYVSRSTDVSKMDDKTVIFFSRPKRLGFATVVPELNFTEIIELENDYYLIRVLDKDTLVGVTENHMNNPSVDILTMKGAKMKTIRPNLLRGLSLQRPEYLLVTGQKRIIIVDEFIDIVICFPSSGTGGFAYSGADGFSRPSPEDIDADDFEKKQFSILPAWVASDSEGNIYVVDKYSGIVVKVDRDGNFIQNILPSRSSDTGRYHRIHIDEKDKLYASNKTDTTGTVKVFEI